MKKIFKTYLVVWLVLLVLFNIIAFGMGGFESTAKFTPGFWVGYVFITLILIGQLAGAYLALKEEDIKKTFYKMSLLSVNYIGLVVSFLVGGLCMLVPALPYWLGIIVCAIVLAATLLADVKAQVAIDAVTTVDEKIKAKTFFTKLLLVDADTLLAAAKNEEIKAECKMVCDAVRYSDPMSNDALSGVEGQITLKFAELSAAVEKNSLEEVKKLAGEVLILVKDRNSKCKLLK